MCRCIRIEKADNKNEDIEIKYLKNMWNNQFLKVKNSLLELEKDFMKLKIEKTKFKERQKNYFISWLLCLKMIWISLKNKKAN